MATVDQLERKVQDLVESRLRRLEPPRRRRPVLEAGRRQQRADGGSATLLASSRAPLG
jgi:hypothetical protein